MPQATQLHTTTAPTPPPFSILALGHHLAKMNAEMHALNVLGTVIGAEKSHDPMDIRRLNKRRTTRAHDAVSDHCEALETLILCSRAITLDDAVCQLMIAAGRLSRLTSGNSEAEIKTEEKQLAHALESVLRAVALAADITLSDVGGSDYAGAWSEAWPDVDTSAVAADIVGLHALCIDGSGA
jgi:hypothetical protein